MQEEVRDKKGNHFIKGSLPIELLVCLSESGGYLTYKAVRFMRSTVLFSMTIAPRDQPVEDSALQDQGRHVCHSCRSRVINFSTVDSCTEAETGRKF